MIIWLTGLPCSGKTTLARRLVELYGGELLDGDELRAGPFKTGFSLEERRQHLLRMGYIAELLDKYTNVYCSFVSPYETTRNELPIDVLIYVKASVECCAARDVKGMWAKAKAGEIKGFTGYDAPYELPVRPDIVVDTENYSIENCVYMIRDVIQAHMLFCNSRQ